MYRYLMLEDDVYMDYFKIYFGTDQVQLCVYYSRHSVYNQANMVCTYVVTKCALLGLPHGPDNFSHVIDWRCL